VSGLQESLLESAPAVFPKMNRDSPVPGRSTPPCRAFKVQSIIACAKLPQYDPTAKSGLSAIDWTSFNVMGGGWSELRIGPHRRFVGVTARGSLTVRGAKSIREARRTLEEAAEAIMGRRRGRISRFRIANVVATTDYGRAVDVTRLIQDAIFDKFEYEPEQFPALTIRFPGSKCTALLFSTGKAVVVGARSLDEVRLTIRSIEASLERRIRA
jgi:TATA-box binding protein (TBP) (component of TFIID and TFIIIB)